MGMKIAAITPETVRLEGSRVRHVKPFFVIEPFQFIWHLDVSDILTTIRAPDMDLPDNLNNVSMRAGYLIEDVTLNEFNLFEWYVLTPRIDTRKWLDNMLLADI